MAYQNKFSEYSYFTTIMTTELMSEYEINGTFEPDYDLNGTFETLGDDHDFPKPAMLYSVIDLTLMSLFLIFGIAGNIMVILVYAKNWKLKQSSANHFLCNLAVTDFIVCVIVIPMHISYEIIAMHRRLTDAECQAVMVIWHQTLICSSWILVGISIDRFYSLCRPFDMRLHSRMVRKIIVSIWVLSVFVAVPSGFYYGQPGCRFTAPVGSLKRIFLAISQATITLILPLAIIGLNYLRIFIVLSKRNRRGQCHLGRSRLMSQTRYIVAKRLLLVIGVFIVCWLPRTILQIYHSFVPQETKPSKVLAVYICGYILPYLNSVLNPLLYSMINPSFRHECWEVITCQKRKRTKLKTKDCKNGSFNRRSRRFSSFNATWL